MVIIKCFLCGKEAEVRRDRKNHYYYKCPDYNCGVIMFVYGEKGMEKFRGFMKEKKEEEEVIE